MAWWLWWFMARWRRARLFRGRRGPYVEVQTVLVLLCERRATDRLRTCRTILCGVGDNSLLGLWNILRCSPSGNWHEYEQFHKHRSTYLFAPPVVSAKGMPRNTEFPEPSEKPFTAPCGRGIVGPLASDIGAFSAGRGLPLTHPRTMPTATKFSDLMA